MDEFIWVVFSSAFLLVVGVLAGWNLGGAWAEESVRDAAVQSGAACYYLDENHERKFRWGACREGE